MPDNLANTGWTRVLSNSSVARVQRLRAEPVRGSPHIFTPLPFPPFPPTAKCLPNPARESGRALRGPGYSPSNKSIFWHILSPRNVSGDNKKNQSEVWHNWTPTPPSKFLLRSPQFPQTSQIGVGDMCPRDLMDSDCNLHRAPYILTFTFTFIAV